VAALDDITIIDHTTSFWAATGVTLLADFGANVLRTVSNLTPTAGNILSEHEMRLAHRNRADTSPKCDEELHELVQSADVFVTDLPFSELESAGLDYETLSAKQPRLIYARASGFGPEGPDRDLPALDELAAARTGMMPILPQPGQPPVYPGSGQMYSSVMLALGVMLALHHREETGEGQRVDVSLLAGNMYGASLDIQAYLAIGLVDRAAGERFLRPISRLDAGNPMSGPSYPAADGRWVTLTMPDTDRYWPRFAPIVGLDPADHRFDTHEKRCEDNRLALIEYLDGAFRKKPSTHWKSKILELGLSADVIETYEYPANDPEARANRYVIASDGTPSIGFPIHMSETPAELVPLTQFASGEHPSPTSRERGDEVASR
jgi:crotonobetainyl-CoA:carnitine CoA-transferase CaiB-like acyl-CoA transferase